MNTPLTRDFRETVQARARRDPLFRAALLREAIDCMLADDMETGKLVLRNYINATHGFGKLGRAMHQSPKSLMRMLSPRGNPAAGNVFRILQFAQRQERVRLSVIEHALKKRRAAKNETAEHEHA